MSSIKSIKPVTDSLTDTDRLEIYRTMLTSRLLDDAEIQMKRQNTVFFQISGAGHEATQTAAARVLKEVAEESAALDALARALTEDFLKEQGEC